MFHTRFANGSSERPPLPKVEIVRADGDGGVTTGKLVAHIDGFWHFFDENNLLASVPDDKVTSVTTMDTDTVWIIRESA